MQQSNSTPTSVLGEPIKVGDFVAWPIGTRTAILRIGEVMQIEQKRKPMLKCRMLTDGRGTVEADRCVHIQPPDYSKAIGKFLTNFSYDDGGKYGTWVRDVKVPITAFDGESYYVLHEGNEVRVRGNAIQVLRVAR